jgi:polysaccharide chain length determinant protein (PEP-CTERM system associated)
VSELLLDLKSLARVAWRRRWIGITVAWVVGLIAAVAVARLPDRYDANARVYVDAKTVLRPLMRDLTVDLDMEQTVGLLAKTLITRPNADLLLTRLFPEYQSASGSTRDRLIEGLMQDIKVTASGRDNVFIFSYRDTDPQRAKALVEQLVSLFLEADSGSKRRDAELARDFIDEQIRSYEARLIEAENRLKDFKMRNLGVADAGGRDYFARIATTTQDLDKLMVELRAAEQAREALRHELDGESMSLLPNEPTVAPRVSEYDARLDALRRQHDDLLRRYTEVHPDVVSTNRLIAQLEEQRKHEVEAATRRQLESPTPTKTTNPVYQQVRLALAEAEANVASLRVRAGDMQARLRELRSSAIRIPQVEAELAQLNRDYDVVKKTYEQMVARREQASLSEEVDATRRAHFQVIDPPRTSPKPVFPNRLALVPAALVAALLAGIAASFAVARIFPTVSSVIHLRTLSQRAVLGSVGAVHTTSTSWAHRRDFAVFVALVGPLLLMYGSWIAWMTIRAAQG